MNNLNLVNKEGILVVDSREVAKMVGHQHKDLLRSIRNYITFLTGTELRPSDFFIPSTYIDAKKEIRPCYSITRKGCDLVANKLTGKKGVLFTAEYITKFEEMEKKLNEPRILSEKEQLMASMKLSLETSEGLGEIKSIVHSLEERFDNELTLNHGQATALNHEIKKRVERLVSIGIMGSLETKHQMYSKIHSQLRRAFQSPTYREIRRTDFDEAIQWVGFWRPL